jgi:hypothetical protein
MEHCPLKYVGVDLAAGPGVDEICSADGLLSRYGSKSFDVVVSTETLEHVRDWRKAVHNLKQIVSEYGLLILTTRSQGFPFHGYPYDYWRYSEEDFAHIFGDLEIEVLQSDAVSDPGVFLRARKPASFSEKDLAGHALYSVVRRRRTARATLADSTVAWCLTTARLVASRALPETIKRRIHHISGRTA